MRKNVAMWATMEIDDRETIIIWPGRGRPIKKPRNTYYGEEASWEWDDADGTPRGIEACAEYFKRCTGISLKPGEIKRIRLTAEVIG